MVANATLIPQADGHKRAFVHFEVTVESFRREMRASTASKHGNESDIRVIDRRTGKILWLGSADHVFIGDVDANDWDQVALVSYPSRQAFIDMVSTPQYNDAHEHREAGLERTVVIACTPAMDRLRGG